MLSESLSKIIQPRITGKHPDALIRKAIITQRLILIAVGICFIYSATFAVLGDVLKSTVFFSASLLYLFSFHLIRIGQINNGRNIFLTSVSATVFICSIMIGVQAGMQFFYYPIAAGAFVIFDEQEPKRRTIFSVSSIIAFLVLHFNAESLQIGTAITPEQTKYHLTLVYIASLAVTIYMVHYSMKTVWLSSRKLAEHRAVLLTTLENIQESIWQIDQEFNLVNYNSTFKKSVESRCSFPIHKGINMVHAFKGRQAFYTDEEMTNWENHYKLALSGKKFQKIEKYKYKGREYYLEVNFGPVVIEKQITGVIASAKDITERIFKEKQLKESYEKSRLLAIAASNITHHVIITDQDQRIEWVNAGFEKNTGYTLSDVIGKKPMEVLGGSLTDEKTRQEYEKKLTGNSPFKMELIHYRKNQEPFWNQVSVNPVTNHKGAIDKIILVGQDISERKRSEEQLQMLLQHSQRLNKQLQARDLEFQENIRELNKQSWELKQSEEISRKQKQQLQQINDELCEQSLVLQKQQEILTERNLALEVASNSLEQKAIQLEQANKYKSEFLANMSHELRTPLNSIIILSRLLAENKESNLSEKQKEFAKVVNKSGSELLHLINDILDLSKIEAGKVELDLKEFKLVEICDDLNTLFQNLAHEKGIEFHFYTEIDEETCLYNDRQRLSQVIKNLLSNAFKFTPKAGKVTIKVEKTPDSNIKFSVSDSGIGIPKDKQHLLFESFSQVDGSIGRKYGGTGLGLSISKELTHLMGGNIHLESSEPGVGSCFSVSIPCGHPSILEKELVHLDQQKDTGKLILIIEDDETFASTLQKFALKNGFRAEICHRGDSGYMRIKDLRPDAILLDINLPGIDGKSLIKRMLADPELNNIPIHVISSTKKEQSGALAKHITWHNKPIDINDLGCIFKAISEQKMENKPRVLVIEDSKEQSVIIKHLLTKSGVQCEIAETGSEGVQLVEKHEFECIILDLNLPDSDGLQILKEIKENPAMTHTPVIVYSSRELSASDKEFLRNYASSYVKKSIENFDLLMDETRVFLNGINSNKKVINQIKSVPVNPKALKGKKVLIVDDDQRNVYSLSHMLDVCELELFVASNGQEAIDVLNKNPEMDLVLMDIMMPGMNGYEATKAIRNQERFRSLPIVALTAKAMKDDYKQSLASGMNEHLVKPIEGEQLLTVMQSYFG